MHCGALCGAPSAVPTMDRARWRPLEEAEDAESMGSEQALVGGARQRFAGVGRVLPRDLRGRPISPRAHGLKLERMKYKNQILDPHILK